MVAVNSKSGKASGRGEGWRWCEFHDARKYVREWVCVAARNYRVVRLGLHQPLLPGAGGRVERRGEIRDEL